MLIYGTGIFLGSFLLFQIQFIMGKLILPWFGGAPAVWNSCLFFFQTVLLAGYAYAHGLTCLRPRRQVVIHISLLLLSLCLFPIIPSSYWKPLPGGVPALQIFLLLTATIGAPFFLLSASAPLWQYWYLYRFPGRSPWRLYALSNTASFLALVSYPFLVEPRIRVSAQGGYWGWGYAAYVLLTVLVAVSILSRPVQETDDPAADRQVLHRAEIIPHPGVNKFLCFFLPACSSAALLAVTNWLCISVAAIPFLWMLPLAIYLATFVICFAHRVLYHRFAWLAIFSVVTLVAEWRMVGSSPFGRSDLLLYLLLLLACCMVCHGELVRLRPGKESLTGYYLSIAAGGALGSAFVTLAAPLLFKSVVELPIAISGVAAAIFLISLFYLRERWRLAKNVLLCSGLLAQIWFTFSYSIELQRFGTHQSRSFYGTLKVVDEETNAGPLRTLFHGMTIHGCQFISPENRNFPTTYFSSGSGVGVALRRFPLPQSDVAAVKNKKVGIVGLGVGTIAAYGVPGDSYRYYELDPDEVSYARQYFTYLQDSAAQVTVVENDARLALERELSLGEQQNFDVLIIDAFTGDAIPVHLLTREAVAVYMQQMKPDGVLLFNITNRFFDLKPVIMGHAAALGLSAAFLASNGDDLGEESALWAVLTRNREFFQIDEVQRLVFPFKGQPVDWTDDYASLFKVLM